MIGANFAGPQTCVAVSQSYLQLNAGLRRRRLPVGNSQQSFPAFDENHIHDTGNDELAESC